MLHRFAAACAIASVAIACGTLATLLTRWPASGGRVLTTAWCLVPLAWGLWAIMAPANWIPRRLPLWGAILGTIAGVIAGPVLNLPLRLADVNGVRWVPVVVGPVFYYLLWILVRSTFISLRVPNQSSYAASGSGRG